MTLPDPSANTFTTWCRDELFTTSIVRAAALLEQYCDLHLTRIYRSLNLSSHLEVPKTAAELTADLGYVDSAVVALEAMLLRLASRTSLVRADFFEEPPRFTATQAGTDGSAEFREIRQQLTALPPPGPAVCNCCEKICSTEFCERYIAAVEFLDFGAEHFVEALRDEPEFMDKVLTGRDSRFAKVWHRATNEDPLQDVHGIMGARLIEKIFSGGRVLEVGGGTGNGMRHLLRHFAKENALSRIETYIFTDISFSFIVTTRQEMKKEYPSVNAEWRHLDMNKPFAEQKFNPASVDLIYGVNAAHCARDIVEFLRQCRMALREGGKAVFSERVRMQPREMAPRELALNLSHYHRTAAMRNPEYRPMHGYLAPKSWLRVLELAGFSRSQVYPDLDALAPEFPDQYAAVIVAEK